MLSRIALPEGKLVVWDWLQHLSGGAATFLGALTGSAIGLVALLLGALFNAHLNRRRDDRLRKEDTRSLAAALKAELAGLNRTLVLNADSLMGQKEPSGFYTPDVAHSVRVMPHLLPKLGLLDTETIRNVIDAYILVEQYCESLLMIGGHMDKEMPAHRRLVLMRPEHRTQVAKMNRSMSTELQKAITRLDEYLR